MSSEMKNLPVPQNALSSYLVEINKFPLLTADEEFKLATEYRKNESMAAAHQLVTSNLRFVVKIANEYRSYGLRMSDLIQEGNIGLMQAVKKFDPARGFRLISYAVWWIRAMIQSYILRSWSLVKIGTTQAQRKLFYKLSQTKRKLLSFFGNQDHLNDKAYHSLAESLDVRDQDVVEMDMRMQGRDSSLSQPLFEGSETTGMDLLVSQDNQETVVLENEEKGHIRSEVSHAMEQLNEKERFIVENRLMTDDPMTLQEIGDRYHISRERARQLEERAKKKIKLVLTTATATRDYCGA